MLTGSPYRVDRRLAAILAADVAGYSRLMGADEEGTLERLKALRRDLIDPKIAEHKGRIVKTTGDGLLVEFASVVDAVRSAVAVQQVTADWNTGVAADNRIELRIGINLGDVIVEGDDLYGDGVNIAARIEALADAGGVFVSNTVHDHVRDRLPFVFEDLGEQQVKNITRPVRIYRVREASATTQSPAAAALPALPLPDKPSIAVLSFANMSGEPEQEYFADGMVEEIITALSRIRWLFVIARNSSFTYKGQAIDVKRVGRELGVHYVLEGSVRRAGSQVRITGQLVDALSGTHVWAGHFDGSLEDVFQLQDQIALSVAAVIEPALQAAEIRRSTAQSTNDVTAYDLYLRALAAFFPVTKEGVIEAQRLLEQAIEIDPHYAPALSWAAHCHLRLVIEGWVEESEPSRHKAVDLPRKALQLVGRSTRSRDRTCQHLGAPEPARARGLDAIRDRHGLLLQTPVCRSSLAAARILPGPSGLSAAIPLSCGVLCPYGAARRSARRRRPAARHHPAGRADGAALAQS
jgi:adenylate cyclase